jgi:hypothetical protein
MRLLPFLSLSLICLPALATLDSVDGRALEVAPGGGIFAHVVDSREWTTSFYITNMDTSSAYVGLLLTDDRGGPMLIPIGGVSSFLFSFILAPDQTTVLETDGVGSLKQGYGLLVTCDRPCSDPASQLKFGLSLGAEAVFRQRIPGHSDSEAVVPMERPEFHTHVVFDGRSGFVTGIALLNLGDGPITVTVRDHLGAVIVNENLSVPKYQKTVFVMGTRYPATTGRYGTIEFKATGGVIALGIRFNPNGSFTSSHALSAY